MGQDICVYVYVPWQIQKSGVLELLIGQWFREILFGLESQEAMAKDTRFSTNSQVRKLIKSWSK